MAITTDLVELCRVHSPRRRIHSGTCQHAMALARVRGEGLRWPSAGFRREPVVFFVRPFQNPHGGLQNECAQKFCIIQMVPFSLQPSIAKCRPSGEGTPTVVSAFPAGVRHKTRRHRVEGTSIVDVSSTFGVSRPTFYQAQTAFERGGLMGLLPKLRGPKTG
jgi:hypothetical protein